MGASSPQRRAPPAAKQRADALAQQYEDQRRRQATALSQLDCLRSVPPPDLLRMAHLCTMRAFIAGTQILDERTPGGFLYLILRGTISLTLHDRTGHQALIGVLNRGDCFGEGPLFGDLFRGATVQAETICYLLQLPLEELRLVMAESPDLTEALRVIYRRRLVDNMLGRVPMLGRLSPLERVHIANLLQPRQHARGTMIIREGTPGDALHLIEAGQVSVERNGQAFAHLDEGDFFGELSLLTDQPHNADVRALTPTHILALPAEEFRRLLAQQPVLATQLREVAERRRAATDAVARDKAPAQPIAAAIRQGLLRGTHLFVRDPNLCEEGCHICEDACATRHGQARLRVDGIRLDGLHIADTCRQCHVGAECVESCPTSAIRWNDHGALLITDACNGCGACVDACPYDAIDLIAHGMPDSSPLRMLWQRLKRFGHEPIALTPTMPTVRADKCDLCSGHADMACISACPTGALRRVPIAEVLPP